MKTATLPAGLLGLILAPLAWADESAKPILTLKGHEGRVSAVAFNSAGTKIATAGADKIVRVWDAKTGELLHKLEGHEQPVLSLAFRPDGYMLASGSANGKDGGEVRLWNVSRGKLFRNRLFASPVRTLAFGEDNAFLAGCANGEIFLRDACTGEDLVSWKLKEASPVFVGFTVEKQVSVMSGGLTPKLWLADAKPDVVMQTPRVYGASIALPSPDGSALLAAGVSEASLCDRKTGRTLHHLTGMNGHVHAAAFTPDGSTLILSHADCHADEKKGEQATELLLWDVKSGDRKAYFPGDDLPVVVSMAVSPDGKKIVTGGNRGEAQVWDLASAKEVRR